MLVVEELGYGHWRWTPGMERRDLLAWFRGVDPADGPRDRLMAMDLPGHLERVDADEAFQAAWGSDACWKAHVHTLGDSWVRPPGGPTVRPLLDPEEQDRLWDEAHDRLEATWAEVELQGTLEGVREVLDRALADGVRVPRGAPRIELDLTWRQIGPGLGRVLAESPLVRGLACLDVTGNVLLPEDVAALERLGLRRLTL
ncbi:MAG: hypothetical protein H6734_11310 [Alphaproteobacteria bacterium]|nr:hypothetical protein [Alphaproteobacteria bacterium]